MKSTIIVPENTRHVWKYKRGHYRAQSKMFISYRYIFKNKKNCFQV